MKKTLISSVILATALLGVGVSVSTINQTSEYLGVETRSEIVVPEQEVTIDDATVVFGDTGDYAYEYKFTIPFETRVMSPNHENSPSGLALSEVYVNATERAQDITPINPEPSLYPTSIKKITGFDSGTFTFTSEIVSDSKLYYPLFRVEDEQGYPYILTNNVDGTNSMHVLGETLSFEKGTWTTDIGDKPGPVNFTQEEGDGYSTTEYANIIVFNDWNDISNVEDTYYMLLTKGVGKSNIVFTQTQINLLIQEVIHLKEEIIEYKENIHHYEFSNGNTLHYNGNDYYLSEENTVVVNPKTMWATIAETTYTIDYNKHQIIENGEKDLHAYSAIDILMDENPFAGELNPIFEWVVLCNEELIKDGQMNELTDEFRMAIFRDKEFWFYQDASHTSFFSLLSSLEQLSDFEEWYVHENGLDIWKLETSVNDDENIYVTEYDGQYKEIIEHYPNETKNVLLTTFASGEKVLYVKDNGDAWNSLLVNDYTTIDNNDFVIETKVNEIDTTYAHVNDKFVQIIGEQTERALAVNDMHNYDAIDLSSNESVIITTNASSLDKVNGNTVAGELIENPDLINVKDALTVGVSGVEEDVDLINWSPNAEAPKAYYVIDDYELDAEGNGTISIITSEDLAGNPVVHTVEFENGLPVDAELNEEESETILITDIIEAVGKEMFFNWIDEAFNLGNLGINSVEDVPEEITFQNPNPTGAPLTYKTEDVIEGTTFNKMVYYSEYNPAEPIVVYQMTFYDPENDFEYVLPVTTGGLWDMAANATTVVEKIVAYAVIMMVYLIAILVLALVASAATWIGFRIKRGYY